MVVTGTAVNTTAAKQRDLVSGKVINEVKVHTLELANTVDAADTTTFDLATVGGTRLLAVSGCKHTTDNSVIVTENPTTTVSSGVITFTIPAGTDDDLRFLKIFYI